MIIVYSNLPPYSCITFDSKAQRFSLISSTRYYKILTIQPLLTTPSLQDDNPICNAILDIATVCNRVENIPSSSTVAVSESTPSFNTT